ncbi:MAG: HAD family phosphatase [Prolixibacteraceae bacterium]|jgi:HAD superfamily hydrolase (TIGR01509 family)|nr:HAD family phosphatase [Prolixibacteraceae bacterium]
MKQCVIFDMDGVIIDSEPIHIACEKEIIRLLGLHIPEHEHHAFIGTTDEIMWSKIGEMYDLPVNVPYIIQLKKSLYMEYLKKDTHLRPISYIPELIADLHRNKFLLALASSSPHEQIDYILTTFGIRNYFQSVVSGEDVKVGKPDPGIFLKAAGSINVLPESCVVIEDSYNGATAAKNANMKCIAYKNPNSGNQDLSNADRIVHSFREISPDLIRELLI